MKERFDVVIDSKITISEIKWNYEENRSKALELAQELENAIITVDNSDYYKKVKTDISKFRKNMSNERISYKKIATKNITKFENEIKEIDKILLIPEESIGKELSFFEQKRKDDKRLEIQKLIDEMSLELPEKYRKEISLNDSFLNISTTQKSIVDSIKNQISNLKQIVKIDEENFKIIENHINLMNETYELTSKIDAKSYVDIDRLNIAEVLQEISLKAKFIYDTEKKVLEKNVVSDEIVPAVLSQAEVIPKIIKNVEIKTEIKKDKTLILKNISKQDWSSIVDFLTKSQIKFEGV